MATRCPRATSRLSLRISAPLPTRHILRKVWSMRKISLLVLLFFMAALAAAQVLPPAEVRDAGPRAFQEKYFDQLKLLAEEVRAHHFPYPFYCSRVLDLDRTQQPAA